MKLHASKRAGAIGAVVLVMGSLLPAAAIAGGGPHEVTVTGTEFEFEPDHLEAKVGEELVITFENEGRISHNLTFPELEQGTTTIQGGETAELAFTPSQPGTYEFICTVPGHANQGMRGELVVSE